MFIRDSISTPLYDQLLQKLANTNDEGILASLASLCLFGELKNKAPVGSAAQPAEDLPGPYSLSQRIEWLLFQTNEQRRLHIDRLAARLDPRAKSWDTVIFNEDDMREELTEWRKRPETWMKSDTLQSLSTLDSPQAVHQKIHRAFSAMLFQLFGNKSLTETLIRFPLCSAAQPASLLKGFAEAWKAGKEATGYKKARKQSQPNQDVRLSRQIYILKQRARRAAWIAA